MVIIYPAIFPLDIPIKGTILYPQTSPPSNHFVRNQFRKNYSQIHVNYIPIVPPIHRHNEHNYAIMDVIITPYANYSRFVGFGHLNIPIIDVPNSHWLVNRVVCLPLNNR